MPRIFYERQGSKQLPQLKEGYSVRFKKPGDKNLSEAVVTGKHETPRSFIITDETGRQYRRNRYHIHPTQEPPVTIVNDDLIGHCRNVRGLGKSMVVFRLFGKLRHSNERSTKFERVLIMNRTI